MKFYGAFFLSILSFSSFAENLYNIQDTQKIFNVEHNKESNIIALNDSVKNLLSNNEIISFQDSQYATINSISNLMNIFKTMQFLDQDSYQKDIFIVNKKYLLELVDYNYNKLFYSYANSLFIEKNKIPDYFSNTIYNATKAKITLDDLNKEIKNPVIFKDILETQNYIMIQIAYLIKENKSPDEVKEFIDSQKNNYISNYLNMAEDLKNKYVLMEQTKKIISH